MIKNLFNFVFHWHKERGINKVIEFAKKEEGLIRLDTIQAMLKDHNVYFKTTQKEIHIKLLLAGNAELEFIGKYVNDHLRYFTKKSKWEAFKQKIGI